MPTELTAGSRLEALQAWLITQLLLGAELLWNARAELSRLIHELETWQASINTDTMRGQATMNISNLMIGVLIAGIIAIDVFIPTINSAIANSNVSGTTKTILGILGLFAALLVLISLASPLMNR